MVKKARYYEDAFKRQIVALAQTGKRASEIAKEYGVSKGTVNVWIRNYANSGSFRAADNVPPLEKELKSLQKENKQLKMENDILKQAALIMARK